MRCADDRYHHMAAPVPAGFGSSFGKADDLFAKQREKFDKLFPSNTPSEPQQDPSNTAVSTPAVNQPTNIPNAGTANSVGEARKDDPVERVPPAEARFAPMTAMSLSAEPSASIMAVTVPSNYQGNLDLHNSYRALHVDTPALTWDDTVAASAAAYAAKCVWGHDSANSQYGENLYAYSAAIDQVQFQADGLKAW